MSPNRAIGDQDHEWTLGAIWSHIRPVGGYEVHSDSFEKMVPNNGPLLPNMGPNGARGGINGQKEANRGP
jgi:hypothetical protein